MRDSLADFVKAFEMPRNQMTEMVAGFSEIARHIQAQVNPLQEAMIPLLAEDGPLAKVRSQQVEFEKIIASDPLRKMRESTAFLQKILDEAQSSRAVALLDLPGLSNFTSALVPLNQRYGGWLNELSLHSPAEVESMASIVEIPGQEMVRTYEDSRHFAGSGGPESDRA